MTDAFNPPVVTEIFTIGYRGVAGDSIIIQATDNFKVNEVKVSIFNSLGDLIGHGEAVQMAKKYLAVKRMFNHFF